MWDKIGYFFVKKDVKKHFQAMNQILAPYSSIRATKTVKIKYNEKINEIAKFAKNGELEREFIEKSKVDNGAYIFALIFVLDSFPRRIHYSDAESVAVDALFDFCKEELIKYKEYAPEIFWEILFLDKNYFYQEMI